MSSYLFVISEHFSHYLHLYLHLSFNFIWLRNDLAIHSHLFVIPWRMLRYISQKSTPSNLRRYNGKNNMNQRCRKQFKSQKNVCQVKLCYWFLFHFAVPQQYRCLYNVNIVDTLIERVSWCWCVFCNVYFFYWISMVHCFNLNLYVTMVVSDCQKNHMNTWQKFMSPVAYQMKKCPK